jgi:hypothetical protein
VGAVVIGPGGGGGRGWPGRGRGGRGRRTGGRRRRWAKRPALRPQVQLGFLARGWREGVAGDAILSGPDWRTAQLGGAGALASCPRSRRLPWKPLRPFPSLPEPLGPVNHRSPCGADVVKVNVVMNATTRPGTAIIPPGYRPATSPDAPRRPDPTGSSEGMPDFGLGHSVS